MLNGSLRSAIGTRLRIALLAVCLLLCMVCFAILSVYLFFHTSVIDPEWYLEEHILFFSNNLWAELLGCAGFAGILWLVHRPLSKYAVRTAERALLIYVILAGMVWALMTSPVPVPIISDTAYCMELGSRFFQRIPPPASHIEYLMINPHQCGFVLYNSLLQWLFGSENHMAMIAINILALAFAYAAVLDISRQCFRQERVQRFVVMLLLLMPQPVLFCTFEYGNIPGLALSLWSVAFLTRFLQGGSHRVLSFTLAIVLCIIGCMIKKNYLIVCIAMAITLLLVGRNGSDAKLPKAGLIKRLALAALMVSLVLITNAIPQMIYEKATGITLGKGTPQTAYFAMGLQESNMAPGWWNGYTTSVLKNNGFNDERTAAVIRNDIHNRADYFTSYPKQAIEFFSKKLVSQWGEPTFESIWVSKVSHHSISPLPAVAASVYDGKAGKALEFWMRIGVLFVYASFAACMALLLRRMYKERNAAPNIVQSFLLPLVVLGGLSYHLLFEAKSQYCATYFPMMIPSAGYAMAHISQKCVIWVKKRTPHAIIKATR